MSAASDKNVTEEAQSQLVKIEEKTHGDDDLVGNVDGQVPVPPTEESTAIPRKRSIQNDPVVVNPVITPTTMALTPGTVYGLPEGVFIPATIHADLLQGNLLTSLKDLPTQLIKDALAEYDDAMTQKSGEIRKHGAYLFGVIKRYKAVAERGTDGLCMGPELTPLINSKLNKMLEDGFCTQDEMNDKVKNKIKM